MNELQTNEIEYSNRDMVKEIMGYLRYVAIVVVIALIVIFGYKGYKSYKSLRSDVSQIKTQLGELSSGTKPTITVDGKTYPALNLILNGIYRTTPALTK